MSSPLRAAAAAARAPPQVHKTKAVVRFMFHNPDDVRWFRPVELWTKAGRRGRIREPVGGGGEPARATLHCTCPAAPHMLRCQALPPRASSPLTLPPSPSSFPLADRHPRQHEVHLRWPAAPAGRRLHVPLQAGVPQVARGHELHRLSSPWGASEMAVPLSIRTAGTRPGQRGHKQRMLQHNQLVAPPLL